jgi:hypothetical protein
MGKKMNDKETIVNKLSGGDEIKYVRSRTFGTSEAPWVGAEAQWRAGMASLSTPASIRHNHEEPIAATRPVVTRDPATDELAAVISTAPPDHVAPTVGSERFLSALKITGIGVLGALLSWIYFGMDQADDTQRIPSRTYDKSGLFAESPVRTATPDPSQGMVHGLEAPHRERVAEPSVGGDGAADAPRVADSRMRSEPSAAIPARTTTAPEEIPARSAEAPAEVTAHIPAAAEADLDERQETASASTAETEPIVDEAASAQPSAAGGATDISDKMVATEDAESAAVEARPEEAAPPGAPLPTGKTESATAAVLMTAKTERLEARVYKDDLPRLLDGVSSKPEERQAKPLSSPIVDQVMTAIAPRVKRCGFGKPGRVAMKVVVSGATGRVIDAAPLDREYRGTPTALCAARALKLAKFPKSDLAWQHLEQTFMVQ